MISFIIFLNFFKIIPFKNVILCPVCSNIVFIFSPAILAFDVEADLQMCVVNRPESILASFIVFLIHLAIASLDNALNDFVVEIKNARSDDLVNLISR